MFPHQKPQRSVTEKTLNQDSYIQQIVVSKKQWKQRIIKAIKHKKKKKSQNCAPVAHTYNPSYLGGGHQETHSSRLAHLQNNQSKMD
jgi:hypothetical protein